MIVNKCSENLLTKSKKLYENYRDNCIVVQRMLEKYKKIYPNGLARIKWRGRNVVFACIISSMMLPVAVTLIPTGFYIFQFIIQNIPLIRNNTSFTRCTYLFQKLSVT